VYQPLGHLVSPASIHRRNQDFAASDSPCAVRLLIHPKKVTPCVEPRVHPRHGLLDVVIPSCQGLGLQFGGTRERRPEYYQQQQNREAVLPFAWFRALLPAKTDPPIGMS
jgi:hypothetical protein